MNRRLRQERQSDLTPTQLSVLVSVRQIGPATPSAIAAHELTHLLEAGLVTREPHPDDGRQVLVAVSAEGVTVLDAERSRRDQWLAHELATLTTDERTTLREAAALLERLAVR
jgi:DNA-binding MarR family transcriptional regulator